MFFKLISTLIENLKIEMCVFLTDKYFEMAPHCVPKYFEMPPHWVERNTHTLNIFIECTIRYVKRIHRPWQEQVISTVGLGAAMNRRLSYLLREPQFLTTCIESGQVKQENIQNPFHSSNHQHNSYLKMEKWTGQVTKVRLTQTILFVKYLNLLNRNIKLLTTFYRINHFIL